MSSRPSRTPLFLAAGLALAALVLSLAWLGRGAAPAALPTERASAPAARGALAERIELAPSARAELTRADAAPQAELAAEGGTTTAGPPRMILVGRVVDERDAPLAAVELVLRSQARWSESADAPSFEDGGRIRSGARAQSAADGSFRFDLPVPSAQRITLEARPDPLHQRATIVFGAEHEPGGESLLLGAGVRDIGALVLATGGAVRGMVRAAGGAPLEGATVRIDDRAWQYPPAYARTDARGAYLLAHLRPGSWTLGADLKGYASASRAPIRVELGLVQEGVDFELQRGTRIAGTLVDQHGAAAEGATVVGTPTAGGKSSQAWSDARGAFTLNLAVEGPHRLTVLDERFERWGGRGVPEAVAEPGQDDLRIVLTRIAGTTFVIVDGESGAPVTRFGVRVEKPSVDPFTDASSPPTPEQHETNEITLPAEPGRHVLWVNAPGYAPREVEVVHDASGDSRQTVTLSRGGALVARLLLGGEPAAGATARLRRHFLDADEHGTIHVGSLDEPARVDLGPFEGHARAALSDAEGRIAFEHLVPGTYHLTLSAPGAAPKRLPGIAVLERGTTDLGELEFGAAGRVLGRVLVGAGLSPVGLTVVLDDYERQVRVAREDGRFELDLAPGEHVLRLQPMPPAVLERVERRFRLEAGQVLEIVLDAATNAPCELTVRVTRDGEPATGVAVEVSAPHSTSGRVRLGATDAAGLVRGAALAGRPVRAVAFSARGLLVGASETVTLPSGGSAELALELATGELVLVFPQGFTLPEPGLFYLNLKPYPPLDSTHGWGSRWTTPGSAFARDAAGEWTARRCELGALAVGSYRLHVQVFRELQREGSAWTEALGPAHEGTFTIDQGETTVVELDTE